LINALAGEAASCNEVTPEQKEARMARNVLFFACLIVLVLVSPPEITAQDKPDTFEVGGLFSLLLDKPADRNVLIPGIGARFTYNPSKYLALETESTIYQEKYFGRPYPGDLALTGFVKINYNGPQLLSLFGVKAGFRSGKIGIFAKARPGFAVFYPVYDCLSGATNVSQCAEIRKKEFAMDFGGVLEGYLSNRILVRFDAGDTYIRFGSTNMLYAGSGVPWINYPYPANNRHRLHVNMGIGVRF
jgi:hypothetical protein